LFRWRAKYYALATKGESCASPSDQGYTELRPLTAPQQNYLLLLSLFALWKPHRYPHPETARD